MDAGLPYGLDEDKLDSFHSGAHRNETPGTWGQPFTLTPINFTTTPYPPMHGSPELLFSQLSERTPFPLATSPPSFVSSLPPPFFLLPFFHNFHPILI